MDEPQRKHKIGWFVPPHNNKLKKIMGISPWSPNHSAASVWIRGYQLGKSLNPDQYKVTINDYQSIPENGIFLRRYDSDDVSLAGYLKVRGCKINLAIMANYSEVHPGDQYGVGKSTQERVANFRKLLNIADQVWTVSPYLMEIASQYRENVHIISDSFDTDYFKSCKKSKVQKPIVFGWLGICTKIRDLETFKSVLIPNISSKKIQLKIISNCRPELTFPIYCEKWNYHRFPNQFSHCDLGIAPRFVDNNYDRGHSLFKIGAFIAMRLLT